MSDVVIMVDDRTDDKTYNTTDNDGDSISISISIGGGTNTNSTNIRDVVAIAEPGQKDDGDNLEPASPKSQQQQQTQPPSSSLPDLEVCLFGPTRKCPKVATTKTTITNTKITMMNDSGRAVTVTTNPSLSSSTKSEGSKVKSDYDSDSNNNTMTTAVSPQQHNIDLAMLRKIASNGVPDEGSHRGVVWRVLLGHLELDNIFESWGQQGTTTTLPSRRQLYRDLVDSYLESSSTKDVTKTTGRKILRGQLSKTLRDRKLRKNYNQLNRRLDDTLDHMGDWSSHDRRGGDGGGDDDDNDDDDDDADRSKLKANGEHSNSRHNHNGGRNDDEEKDEDDESSNNGGDDDDDDNDDDDAPSTISGHTTETPSSRWSGSHGLGMPNNSDNDNDNTAGRSTPSTSYGASKIYDRLASPKHRELWKHSGIRIDRFSFTTGTQSDSPPASSSSSSSFVNKSILLIDNLNLLRVPKELMVTMVEEETTEKNEGQHQVTSHQGETSDHDSLADNNNDSHVTSNIECDDGDAVSDVDSVFVEFLRDAKLLQEIRKDVVRTHPDLRFYLEPVDDLGVRRYAALERILYIWAKQNGGVRYVQGMNEIVATIYYVLANDHNSDWANEAEADAYYLFNALMVEMKDVFDAAMDSSVTGIQGRISNMQALLHRHDPEIQAHLEELGIDAAFYAIRWLTTLLSREFLLPDTIRLWDSMFASTHKENFLRYVCVTMVMNVRDRLLVGDFATCLRMLQSYPPTHVDDILESSRALWIYESQVNLVCLRGGVSLHQALQMVSAPATIIMAFGLRGGVVATKLTDQTNNDVVASTSMEEQVDPVKTRLLGRAKQLWSGLGILKASGSLEADPPRAESSNGNDAIDDRENGCHEIELDEPDAVDLFLEAAGAGPPEPLRPTTPDGWNGERSGSDGSPEQAEEPNGKGDTQTGEGLSNHFPAVSRLWGRGRQAGRARLESWKTAPSVKYESRAPREVVEHPDGHQKFSTSDDHGVSRRAAPIRRTIWNRR